MSARLFSLECVPAGKEAPKTTTGGRTMVATWATIKVKVDVGIIAQRMTGTPRQIKETARTGGPGNQLDCLLAESLA